MLIFGDAFSLAAAAPDVTGVPYGSFTDGIKYLRQLFTVDFSLVGDGHDVGHDWTG